MSATMLNLMLPLVVAAHAGQVDKAGKPYVLHVLKVMHYLKSDDEELQCIALGHDLFEDTCVTPEELRTLGISERVVIAIDALTKKSGQSYKEYQEKVFGNVDAMRVKQADLRHNTDIRRLKGVTDRDIARMTRYHEFYLEIQERLKSLQ